MKRWDVELVGRLPADGHGVVAHDMRIHESGALVFYVDSEVVVAYGPGVWSNVTYEYDEDAA